MGEVRPGQAIIINCALANNEVVAVTVTPVAFAKSLSGFDKLREKIVVC
jgi:hypothetical protein